MKRATIYETTEQTMAGPCTECQRPNGAHFPAEALHCWRKAIRHPDADADDILAAVGGAVLGVAAAGPNAANSALGLLEEIETALEERLATVEAEVIQA